MKQVVLRTPELGFVVVTRAALAFGVGLLVSRRMSDEQRTRIGGALVAVGALSTIPALMLVMRNRRRRFERAP